MSLQTDPGSSGGFFPRFPGMGKNKDKDSGKQSKRMWKPREEAFLIQTMKDLVAKCPRNKQDCGTFKAGFYNECDKKIILHFPGTDLRAKPHIESKIKGWKKQYHVIQDMLKLSGFGWDDQNKMILVDSDDVWNNYVRANNDARGMRDKPFPLYDDWVSLFGKDRATGQRAEGPTDSAHAQGEEVPTGVENGGFYTPLFDFNNFADTAGGSPSTQLDNDPPLNQFDNVHSTPVAPSTSAAPSTSSVSGKKRPRSADSLTKTMADMSAQFGVFNTRLGEMVDVFKHDRETEKEKKEAEQRNQISCALKKLPLTVPEQLTAGTRIVQNQKFVDYFLSLIDPEYQLA